MVIVTEFSKGFLVVFILLHIDLILNFIWISIENLTVGSFDPLPPEELYIIQQLSKHKNSTTTHYKYNTIQF